MRSLNPSAQAPVDVLRAIAGAKNGPRRTRLRALLPRVEARYTELGTTIQELVRLTPAAYVNLERDDLIHCYAKRTGPLSALAQEIRVRQPLNLRFQCPYCGFGQASQLDHYLPQRHFPEFAVHPLNLVPCCNACNLKKEETYPENGTRHLVHAYLDKVPNVPFLKAKIEHVGGDSAVAYSLVRDNISEELYDLLEKHVAQLNLLQRLRETSSRIFAEARTAVELYNANIREAAAVRVTLLIEAERWARAYVSVNYWRAVVYRALAEDTLFVESCCDPAD